MQASRDFKALGAFFCNVLGQRRGRGVPAGIGRRVVIYVIIPVFITLRWKLEP
jgi:hypothetical protein